MVAYGAEESNSEIVRSHGISNLHAKEFVAPAILIF